jgi:membrane-associated phospholipid phosphatase
MGAMVARVPLAVPLGAACAFVVLLVLDVAGWAPLGRFDEAVSATFRRYGSANAGVVATVRVLTDVAATVPFLAAGAALAALLAARRERVRAVFVAAVTVTIPAVWGLFHALLHSPRPLDGFVFVDSNGFPSGHTANASAAALVAVLLIWPAGGRGASGSRIARVAAAAAFAALIGLTRLALLAHWPSDVLGGWLVALAVVPLLARAAVVSRAAVRR